MGPNQSADQTRHHAFIEGVDGRTLVKEGSIKNSMEQLDGKGGWIHLSRMQKKIWQVWERALKRQKQIARLKKLRDEELMAQESAPQGVIEVKGQNSSQKRSQSKISDLLMAWKTVGSFDTLSDPDDDDDGVIHLTIYVSDNESVKMPLDLTEHDSLQTVTSQWLHTEVFKIIKDQKLQTRSASHSKNTAGSTEPTSSQGSFPLEPVSLSTQDNQSECIDFLLTRKDEMIATFLQPTRELRVNYVSKFDFDEDNRKKLENAVPSLRDFEFIKVIGKGGFATVYMVRKRTTGKLYAMKTVKKAEVKQNENRFAQVLRERNILSQLQNPFLVSLQYAFETTNYYCLVIDLCTGGELFYYLQKNQSFKLQSAKILFAEVILAMEFLHKNNILYRDLKPENILVDERGHLKLTDFGLCKHNFKRRDRADSFVGSPEYMSPEILLGKPYNFSVDYYTLGVLLFEMLVGLPPHYNEDKIQMYTDITMKKPVIPALLQGDIKDLLERLLEINPENRLGMQYGIKEIKDHPFFSDIDWYRLAMRQPQTSYRKKPLEVNILHSNFDKEYTLLPIQIDPVEEELIRIKDPIQLYKSKRKRSGSFCFGVNKRRKIKKRYQQSMLVKNMKMTKKGSMKVDPRRGVLMKRLQFPNHQSDEHLIEAIRQGTPQGMAKLPIPQDNIKRESKSVLMSERIHQEQNLTDRQGGSPGGTSCRNPAYDDINIEMFQQNSVKRTNGEVADLSMTYDQKPQNFRNSVDFGAYENQSKGWTVHNKVINSAEVGQIDQSKQLPTTLKKTISDRHLNLGDSSYYLKPQDDTASAQFNYRKMTMQEDELLENTQSELDISKNEGSKGNYNSNTTAGQQQQQPSFAIKSQELKDQYRTMQASQLKVTITKGLNRPTKPNFDAEKVTREEILDEYTGTAGSCYPDAGTNLNFTQRSSMIHSRLQKHIANSPPKPTIEVTSANESSSHMAWQPEMEQSLRKHEVVQFKAESSQLPVKVANEGGQMTPNEIETPQANSYLHLNESAVHNQVIMEEEDNCRAGDGDNRTGSLCSEDYGADAQDEDQSSEESSCQSAQEAPAGDFDGQADVGQNENLLENIARSKKKRQKSEENYDGGMLIEKNQELPVFDLFNYGFSVEQESPILKAKKNNLIKAPQLKNFKITPFICNKAINATTPFSIYSNKSKKLLNFTEKANEVISERNRVPRKQNLQLLKKKLLHDEEEENQMEETEGYLDEQSKPQTTGHHQFSHHINLSGQNPLQQFKKSGYQTKPEMQLSQHLLQLPNISVTATASPQKKVKQTLNGVGTQSPRQPRLKTSKSNDYILPINDNSENTNTTPKVLQLQQKQSSGDKSHFFVMSLNKTTQSRDEFSTSNKAATKNNVDKSNPIRQSASYIKSPDKHRNGQTSYKQFTFSQVKSGNLSSSRNKMEKLNSHASETLEDKSLEVSTCKSPTNKTKTEEKKGNVSKQKTQVKKILGKIGMQQNSSKYVGTYSQRQSMGDKSDHTSGKKHDRFLNSSDLAKDAYIKFPKNSKANFGGGKTSIKSCNSSQSIVSKSNVKCSLAPNGPVQYFQGVLDTNHPLFVTTNFEQKQQQNLSQRSINTHRVSKLPGPGSLSINSPTATKSNKIPFTSTSPSQSIKSPIDRVANTKAVVKHHTSHKSTKQKPHLAANQSLYPNKTKASDLRKSAQLSLKTARQKIGIGKGFDSPILNENETQLRQAQPDPTRIRENLHGPEQSQIQVEQKTLATKGRSKSDLKYGSSQRSLTKCFMTSESSFMDEKRRSMPGNLIVQPFLKQLKRQQNNEKVTKMLPLHELIRSGSEAKRVIADNPQSQSQANIVKNFPRTLSLFDSKFSRSNSANRTTGQTALKRTQQSGQLDYVQKSTLTRSLVGSEIFKKDMSHQMPQKRLPGQEDRLNGDSIKITETKDNDDMTRESMLQLYTQEKYLNETSIEELNLIAMAERSAIEATQNHVSIQSSKVSESPDGNIVRIISQDEEFSADNPELVVCEVSGSSKYSDDDQICASEGHQITLTSQDLEDPMIQAQLQNDAGISYNVVNKKSFVSNKESLLKNRQQKASFLNENAFKSGSDYKFQVQDQKSPNSQKPDNRNSLCQSSSNNHTDNNNGVNLKFDKRLPHQKTAYTTCNHLPGKLSQTFNDGSQSSDSHISEKPINRESMISCTQPKVEKLEIDANAFGNDQNQATSSSKNASNTINEKNKKSSTTHLTKNNQNEKQKAKQLPQLTPDNFKDPKSNKIPQQASAHPTAKNSGTIKPLTHPPSTKHGNSNTYYKQEEKFNTHKQSSSKLQGGNRDSGKFYLLENSHNMKNNPVSLKKGDSALEYGKQSSKKNFTSKNFRTVGSQQSIHSLSSTQNSTAMPARKSQKHETMKNMVMRQKTATNMKPNSLWIDQKQLTHPNEMRSSTSGQKKQLHYPSNRKSELLSPKQSYSNFTVQKSLKRENEKTGNFPNSIPKSQSGIHISALLSPQKLSSSSSQLAFNQSLVSQSFKKQRSRSNLQEPARQSIGNLKKDSDKETHVSSIQIYEDQLRVTNTQSSLTHTPTTATINLLLNTHQSTPHVSRENQPNSALGVSTQNSNMSQQIQKVKPKKSIPSAQINLHDVVSQPSDKL